MGKMRMVADFAGGADAVAAGKKRSCEGNSVHQNAPMSAPCYPDIFFPSIKRLGAVQAFEIPGQRSKVEEGL